MNQALPRSHPLRVGIYARYSSENQRDASIEDQIRICRARAEREGWVIAETFTDYALSGSTTLRPGYQALMSAIRSGQISLVLAESLDRLSRDQEHVAAFHKAAQFAGVRIFTLSEGEISELHVGLKGTMGALYLKDLADKTRRGLEGRVRQGRSGGGLCYGYRVVRGPMGRDGEMERGLREIDEAQASVVRRIFTEFAGGAGRGSDPRRPRRGAHATRPRGRIHGGILRRMESAGGGARVRPFGQAPRTGRRRAQAVGAGRRHCRRPTDGRSSGPAGGAGGAAG